MDDQTQTFLQLLWAGGRAGYYWRASDKRSQWIDVFPPADCALGTSNIYFGVHPTIAQRDVYQRSRIEDVAMVNVFFAEWDTKDYNNDKGAIRTHILGLSIQPQIIIDSGGGYHGYWLLRDGVEFAPANREYLAGTQAAWVRMTGGDPGAKDMARVLRLPGTFNAKYDPPRRVSFVRFNYTGLESELYDVHQLCSLADDYWDAPDEMRIIEPKTTSRAGAIAALVDSLRSAKDGERNRFLYWTANRMFDYGLSESGVQAELLSVATGLGLHERETLSTIRSASKQERKTPTPPDTPRTGRGNGHAPADNTLAARKRAMQEAMNG